MEARRAIVGAHGKLERLRDDLGLPATAFGCTTDKPLEPPAEREETAQLKAV
jgi:hypothetical protein